MTRPVAARQPEREAAILDAARTRWHWEATGAYAKDIGKDLVCAPNWVAIEMDVRQRLMFDLWVAERSASLKKLLWAA